MFVPWASAGDRMKRRFWRGDGFGYGVLLPCPLRPTSFLRSDLLELVAARRASSKLTLLVPALARGHST
jgi:hypothetical protein